MKNRTAWIVCQAVFLVLITSTSAHANMILSAYFTYVPAVMSIVGIFLVLTIEFIVLRVAMFKSTTDAVLAGVTMNAASTLMGVVFIPLAGTIIGLLSWKHGMGDMLTNLFVFAGAVLFNVISEAWVIRRLWRRLLEAREYAAMTIANALSCAAIAGLMVMQSDMKL